MGILNIKQNKKSNNTQIKRTGKMSMQVNNLP